MMHMIEAAHLSFIAQYDGNERECNSGMNVALESFWLQRALTKAVNIYSCPIKLSFPNDYFRSLLAGVLLLAH